MKIIKSSLLFLLATLIVTTADAQRKYTDSLNYELTKVKHDTSKVLVMADLAYYHRYQNLDTAMVFAQRALALSQKIEFFKGESLAYQMMGNIHRIRLNMPAAFQNLYKGLQVAEESDLKYEKAICFTRIASAFSSLQQDTSALKFNFKALNTLGSERITRAHVFAWLSLGSIYERLNKLDSAGYYKKKAFDNMNVIPDFRSTIYSIRARDLYKDGNRALALKYFTQSLKISEGERNHWEMSTACTRMAAMYHGESQQDSAIYYAKRGLENGLKVISPEAIQGCGNLLAEIYESSNPAEALRYYKIASAAKESLFGAGNLQAIQAIVEREEARQKDLAEAKLAYQAQLKLYGLLVGLGVFLVVAFILYRSNRQKHKANIVLQEQKEKVENALQELKSTQSQLIQSEKMASLGELTAGIAHEIQNPLNFVNNFSEVSSELVDEMKSELETGNLQLATEISNDLKQNLEKINHHGKRAADIVKGMLQHSRSSSGAKEPTDINALADEYLRLAYHGLRAKDKDFNATMKTDFDELIGNINIIPQDIGRVILNLITNAFYAVNEKATLRQAQGDSYHPTVSVSTKKEGNKVLISVKDNGNGIPQKILDKIFQPFFTTKPTGQGTGLGLSLSYDIVKAHGGELKVETLSAEATAQAGKDGVGSEFIIHLPIV